MGAPGSARTSATPGCHPVVEPPPAARMPPSQSLEALAAESAEDVQSPAPIAGVFVRLFLQGADRSDRHVASILARAGIDAGRLDDPALRLSEQQFTRFLIGLSRRSRDEFWGLASRPVPLGTFHTLCRLIVNCATLGEALTIGGRFYRLVIDDFAVKTRTQAGTTTVWLATRPGGPATARCSSMQGAALFMLYQLMCWLVDRRLPLAAVDMAFTRRPHSAEPLRAYETSVVRFDQPHTALQLETHLLSLPILGDERRLSRFLSQVPRALLLRYHDDNRVKDKVRALLRRGIAANLSLENVADRLHMTAATLHRRLMEEGCASFTELRDEVRRQAAVELLKQRHLTLEKIASRLGFAEHSTFHRAFKRWTGIAPGEYRQRAERGEFEGVPGEGNAGR